MYIRNIAFVFAVSLVWFQYGIVQAEDTATMQTSSSEIVSATNSAPPEADTVPTQTVGDLTFKITSLRISSSSTISLHTASIWMTIKNNGKTPIALNYSASDGGNFVNEFGDRWNFNSVSGVGLASSNSASMDYLVAPGGELRAVITMNNAALSPNQSNGNTFNFEAIFLSFRDIGGGRLHKDHTYPVSFVGIHESSIVSNVRDQVKDQVKGVSGQIQNALKSIFGN